MSFSGPSYLMDFAPQDLPEESLPDGAFRQRLNIPAPFGNPAYSWFGTELPGDDRAALPLFSRVSQKP